jgi:hypothetical protein
MNYAFSDEENKIAEEKACRLYLLSFGGRDRISGKDIPPIYALPGLKRNARVQEPDPRCPYDGSYSLASTVEEGNGQGIFVPAMQTKADGAGDQIAEVLTLLNYFCRRVMKTSLTKFENEVLDHHAKDQNIFVLGGLDPGAAAAQLNASSGFQGGSLAQFLGVQGKLHLDHKDCKMHPTVFQLLMKVPEGQLHYQSICQEVANIRA